MVCFTFLVSIILRHGWRQRKPPSKPHFAFVRTQVKHILRALKIFITDTSTMMVLWQNWPLRAGVCRMILEYSQSQALS